jgi:hypothetical protein
MRSHGLVVAKTAHDPLQQLTGLGHHKPQTIEVDQHLEQLRTVERFHAIRQLAAFAKRDHEIISGLRAAGGDAIWC